MAGTTGKWILDKDGDAVALDHVVEICVWPKDGPPGYEVRARTVTGGRAVLFEHRDEEICREWLSKFVKAHLDVIQPVVLTRRCPECCGTGLMPSPAPDSKEPCPLCDGEREVSLQVYEAAMEALEVFGGQTS